MNSLQEAYKSVSEAQEPDGMKLSDKKNIQRQKQLLDASKKAPTYKNKIVPTKTRTEEAIKMSRKEYAIKEVHQITPEEEKRTHNDFINRKTKYIMVANPETGGSKRVPYEVKNTVKKKVVPEGVDKKKEMEDKMKEVEDMRSLPTRMNLIKTKLRAMGLNMSHVLKGKELSEVTEFTISELNRYEKETGKSSGSMNMPKGKPTQKGGDTNPVMRKVRTSSRKGRPEGQQKQEKAVKTTAGTNKYLNMQNTKREYAAKAKEAGFKSTQDYTNTMAIYGGEANYKAGKGSGS